MPASTLVHLGLKVTPEIKRRIREGADSSGKTISDFVRELLDAPRPFDLAAAIEALDPDPSAGLIVFWKLFNTFRDKEERIGDWLARKGLTSPEALKAFATSAFPEG
jgi:hypothetical protein